MKKNDAYRKHYKKLICIILLFISSVSVFVCAEVTQGMAPSRFDSFNKAFELEDDEKAVEIGDQVFEELSKEFRADSGFAVFQSKLVSAEYLAKKMSDQLRKACSAQIAMAGKNIFGKSVSDEKPQQTTVPPAKEFYENARQVFAEPVKITNLTTEVKTFLSAYYDLKLRKWISDIARAGQGLALAEPGFDGTYNYVLVLPLLNSPADIPIDLRVFPRWLRSGSHLQSLADSCLLHYGFVERAMLLTRDSAQQVGQEFYELDYYRKAAQMCGKEKAHVAVACLKKAGEYIRDDETVEEQLNFDIAQLWLDSDNYAMAAGQAKLILEKFTESKRTSEAVWLYYYSLSQAGSAAEILASIDTALDNEKFDSNKAMLIYIKWWALRRHRDKQAELAAVEHELLTKYGKDEIVAPVMLSRASDLLARQEYDTAAQLLNEVSEKFPSSNSAHQAARMIDKLKKLKENDKAGI